MTHSPALKHHFDRVYAQADDPLALKRIGLIGAKVTPGHAPDLGSLLPHDRVYFEDTIKLLHEYALPVPQNLQARIINAAYGHDYLAPAKTGQVADDDRLDIAVSCYLHNPADPEAFRKSGRNNGNAWVSPHHGEQGVWARASALRGAKVVVVYGFDPCTDVMPREFASYPYFQVMHFGQDAHSPYGSGGMLMHRHYAQEMLQQGRLHDHLAPFVEENLKGRRAVMAAPHLARDFTL